MALRSGGSRCRRGVGAVLGDVVQFPSVPLIVGELLSIPTPRFPAWQAGRMLLCMLCERAGKKMVVRWVLISVSLPVMGRNGNEALPSLQCLSLMDL